MAIVLIMNDEPDLLEGCRMVLEADGHSIIATTNPAEGVRLAATVHPDVVLLDWVMPRARGDEVLRRLRHEPSTADIPIVMMSALADGEARSKEAGADAFLAKPFDVDQLARMIAAVACSGTTSSAGQPTPGESTRPDPHGEEDS